jgi:hypothetical protein
MGQKAPGFYQIKGAANLRWRRNSKGEYQKVTGFTLQEGDVVYPTTINWEYFTNEQKECYFDGKAPRSPGWRTDHTWVMVISQIDEEGQCPTGWVDNDRMSDLRNEIEANFAVGDVLYGRWEARVPWRGATGQKGGEIGEEIGSKIGNYKYNIIDDFNNAILSRRLNDEDVNNFAMFLGTLAKKNKKLLYRLSGNVQAADVRIRSMCKCGLTYVTNELNRKVHFILDGLSSERVVSEAGVLTKQGVQGQLVHQSVEKFCTGAEVRTLMRQAMYNKGLAYGKDYNIKLANVLFYLRTERVPAPWENNAPAQWKVAWQSYCQYRLDKQDVI